MSLGYIVQRNVDSAKVEETDFFTCGHCNKTVTIRVKTAVLMLRRCLGCMRHVCTACHAIAKCDVIELKLERAESRARMLKAIT